ncbi:alpha/beta fold hydrolase [Candidatus Dojkabacteria bacterium]|uniref:Alpha/beta fold hydrolase n=1 Tax=Candidatus Dojkabacteria bacterium TaxID=2099670 RepID=A0A955I871_9BACT|nr:alpha/beta fold hydrolase [Candidatus Dojkabacteria bacterium]
MLEKEKEVIKLKNGKTISYSVYGNKNGYPILMCHGANGTRLQAMKFADTADALNLKIITPDRPGYGESTTEENRDYLEWADDISEFLDLLGIEKLGILGISAGANYALACVYKYPSRFKKVVMVSATSGAFLYRKGPEKKLAEIVMSHPKLLHLYMEFIDKVNGKTKELKFNIQKFGLSDSDLELFENLDLPELIDMSEREAYINGPEAPASDVLRMLKDIDFDSKSIKKQVTFWYGARDKIVPLETVAFIENIVPKYKIVIKSDAGHLLVFQHMKEILSEFV